MTFRSKYLICGVSRRNINSFDCMETIFYATNYWEFVFRQCNYCAN